MPSSPVVGEACASSDAPPDSLPADLFLFPRQNDGFQVPFFLATEKAAAKVRPPPVVKTLEQRLEELSEKEIFAFKELKKIVQLSLWCDESLHDDWALIRYLVACGFKVKKALEMLEKSARWWKEMDVANLGCQKCLENPNKHMMQFVGWDLQYRPVCFMSMRLGPDRSDPIPHCVYTFKHLLQLMPVGVEKWVFVTDFETYSHLRDTNIRVGTEVIKTIQNHFPERLGMIILVNPPSAFSVLWKLSAFAIDKKTKEKVVFWYTKSKPNIRDEFPKLFPSELSAYLCETYLRCKEGKPPSSFIWNPCAEKPS
uniref:CRAL-TRIO domain-containing protein n=1 Tax=Trypanosoma congolense (strain IL3000) TaxID=1068625 RepID=G0UUL7_TRYCI|nr:conserved hypothetical protein [Trypanosoma congolense IL3000]